MYISICVFHIEKQCEYMTKLMYKGIGFCITILSLTQYFDSWRPSLFLNEVHFFAFASTCTCNFTFLIGFEAHVVSQAL